MPSSHANLRRNIPLLSPLRGRVEVVRAFFQRGTRGWADQDSWNMDMYLARVIGEMLHYLADTDFGHSPKFETPAEWVGYLHTLALAFEEYQTLEVGSERYEQVVADMRGLFDYFGDLWT